MSRSNKRPQNHAGLLSNNHLAPKQFAASITQIKRFRFQFVSAPAGQVLLNAASMGCFQSVVLTSTTAQSLFNRVRVVSVELFAPMPDTLAPVTVSLEWISDASNFSTSSRIYSDTSMTASMCAHLHCVPEPDSFASKWQYVGSSSANIIGITCPINTIVDIVLEFCLNDGETPFAVQTILTTTQPIGSIGVKSPVASMAALGLPALRI